MPKIPKEMLNNIEKRLAKLKANKEGPQRITIADCVRNILQKPNLTDKEVQEILNNRCGDYIIQRDDFEAIKETINNMS